MKFETYALALPPCCPISDTLPIYFWRQTLKHILSNRPLWQFANPPPRIQSAIRFLHFSPSFPLHTMSEYIKSTLAILPHNVHSLHSFSSYRPNLPNLPNIQFPTTNFQGKNSLPTRNPRAFVALAVLLFLLFWKDIIRDVCSHVATRRLPVPVVEVSPIRNNTLGVNLLEECISTVDR